MDGDSEIRALEGVANALESLGKDARHRVLKWAWSRYVIDPHVAELRKRLNPPLAPVECLTLDSPETAQVEGS